MDQERWDGIVGQASGIMPGIMLRTIPRGRALPRVSRYPMVLTRGSIEAPRGNCYKNYG